MGEKPTDFQRLRALCQHARGLDPDDLTRFLERECGGNPAVADEVRRLLQLDICGDDVLEGQAHEAMGLTDDAADVTVTRVDGASPDTTWEEFLAQVRGRGENWSRYEDQGEVARGGMGAIHRVFDQDLRRTLAMKVILNRDGDPAETDALLGRFLEEAQVTSQLDHPGIVPIHELGVDREAQVYFTMKLVKGEDLRSVFERVSDPSDADWTETRALNIMLRVCEAMAYAHSKGVIHRDLKPGNVMVGKYGETYVMDWGLAKVLGQRDTHDLRVRPPDATATLRTERKSATEGTPDSPYVTMSGTPLGTPHYMPPEQARGHVEDIGPAADVYAVGATMYQLLAGRAPYAEPRDRMSQWAVIAMVAGGPPVALFQLAPRVPAELAAIVEKAMAREIPNRYPDMTALARDLRAFLENRVVGAYETGAWAELRKWVKRNKALATMAAVAVVAVLATAGWALMERRAARENEQTALANEADAKRERDRADKRTEEAEDARQKAEVERDRVKRLSDRRRLDVLLQDADTLWPAHPEKTEGLKDWLGRADALLRRLPIHEAKLAEVRAKGTPLPHPRDPDLSSLREHVALHAAGEGVEGEAFEDEAALAEHIDGLEAAFASLELAIARERGHDFGEDEDSRWWHDVVRDLVVGLHPLRTDDVHRRNVAGIEARLAWAETVEERTTTGPGVAAKWAEAREAIRANPMYGGLNLEPQLGLVPLGPDPESTLWEFGHLQTGDLAVRDSGTGKLAISEAQGLVLVLIPGGTYRIGAQTEDEDAPHFDPQADPSESPVHEVTLSPYLLSKYEMTQGQYVRISGKNPSFEQPESPELTMTHRHPVDQVSWEVGREMLGRLGLVLPTESQWEAACRAGTGTPWSTGRERESLQGFSNLADLAALRSEEVQHDTYEGWNDSFAAHAPVGSYRPNEFGLHDMHGNVSEWCQDDISSLGYGEITPRDGDGLRDGKFEAPRGASVGVTRGGSYYFDAMWARSSQHSVEFIGGLDFDLGLRPARTIEP